MNRSALTLSLMLIAPLLAAQAAAPQRTAPGGVSSLKGHDSNAPVDVQADRLEVQDRADRAIFVGNVVAVQADMTLKAPRVTVIYNNTPAKPGATPPPGATAAPGGESGIEIQRIDATGGVTVTSPTETAVGQYAIYDLNSRLITMIGGVTLTQGANHVSGGRLTIDLNTGRAVVDGNAVGARGTSSSGGRVTGRFTAPQRNTVASGTAPGA